MRAYVTEPGKGPRPLGLRCTASWLTETTRKSTSGDGAGRHGWAVQARDGASGRTWGHDDDTQVSHSSGSAAIRFSSLFPPPMTQVRPQGESKPDATGWAGGAMCSLENFLGFCWLVLIETVFML